MAFGFIMGPAVALFGQEVRATLIAASAMLANGVNTFMIKMQTAEKFSPALLMDGVKLLIGSGGVSFAGIAREGVGSKLQAGSIFNSIATYIVPLAREPILFFVGGCDGIDPEVVTVDWPAGMPTNCASEAKRDKAGWAIKSLEMGIIGTGVKLADKMSFLLVIFNSASMGANMVVSAVKNLMLAQTPKKYKKQTAAMMDKFGFMMFGFTAIFCIKFQLKQRAKAPPEPVETKGAWKQVLGSNSTFNKTTKGVVVSFEVQADKNALISIGDPKDKDERHLQVCIDFKSPEADDSDPPVTELREVKEGVKTVVGEPSPGIHLDEDEKKKFRITFDPETTEFAVQKAGMMTDWEDIVKEKLPVPPEDEQKEEGDGKKKKKSMGQKLKAAKAKIKKKIPSDPAAIVKAKALKCVSILPLSKIPKIGPKLNEKIQSNLEAAKADKEQADAMDKLFCPKGCWVKTECQAVWIVWPAKKVKVEDPNKPKPTGWKKYVALLIALIALPIILIIKIGMAPLMKINGLLQMAIKNPELMNAEFAKKMVLKKIQKLKQNKDVYVAMARAKMGKGKGGGSAKVGDEQAAEAKDAKESADKATEGATGETAVTEDAKTSGDSGGADDKKDSKDVPKDLD